MGTILRALWLTVFLSGCYLEVSTPHGGEVRTSDGQSCRQGVPCVFEISDSDFNETFTALRDPGYRFTGWKQAPRYLCWGKQGPCRLSTSGFSDNPVLAAMLESDGRFYLEPEFARDTLALAINREAGTVHRISHDGRMTRLPQVPPGPNVLRVELSPGRKYVSIAVRAPEASESTIVVDIDTLQTRATLADNRSLREWLPDDSGFFLWEYDGPKRRFYLNTSEGESLIDSVQLSPG